MGGHNRMNIITQDIITDVCDLNPGYIISDIICRQNDFVHIKEIEFLRLPDTNLEFKPIPSLNNAYEINENGTIFRNAKTKKQLKIILDMHHSATGYYATFICLNGIVRRLMIHKLVAEAWLGPIPEGLEVDHIDRNSHNNHYTNLRYVTHSDQMKNRVLGARIIEQAKANCRKYIVEKVMKPVKIISPKGDILDFCSFTECSKYLAKIFNNNVERIRKGILGKRKVEYNGYKIIYINEKMICIE